MLTFIRTPFIGTCLVVSTLTMVGCATQTDTTAPMATSTVVSPMMAALMQDPELSTFTRLVQTAGLAEAISSGEVTVFAPTDEAFKAVPAATLDKLSKDPEMLKSVLNYHVLPSKTTASSVEGSMPATTLNGAKLGLSRAGDFVTADDSLVTTADIAAGAGLIHKVDRVLMPAVKK
jgi:uncharacterized surface protein with fasciclin (FAS1) repeats